MLSGCCFPINPIRFSEPRLFPVPCRVNKKLSVYLPYLLHWSSSINSWSFSLITEWIPDHTYLLVAELPDQSVFPGKIIVKKAKQQIWHPVPAVADQTFIEMIYRHMTSFHTVPAAAIAPAWRFFFQEIPLWNSQKSSQPFGLKFCFAILLRSQKFIPIPKVLRDVRENEFS